MFENLFQTFSDRRSARALSCGSVSFGISAGFSLVLAGCGLGRMGSEEVSTLLEKYEQSQVQQAESYIRKLHQKQDNSKASTKTESASPTALREYIVLALQDNPDIKRAEETARAKATRIPQVTALPDPILRTKTLIEPVRTAEGDSFFVLGVSQKFPVPAKLDRAGRIALEETRMALRQLEEIRLRVIADVKRSYFQVYAIDKSIAITNENKDLLEGLIDVARGQVAAGTRAQEDVLRAQVELSNLEAQLVELRQRRLTAQAMLNQVMNRPSDTPVPVPEEFDVRNVDQTLQALLDKAVELNPELKQIHQQIERDKQVVELARLAYWPDFTIGFEWMLMESREAFRPPINAQTGKRPVVSKMSEDGSDNWAMTFGLNIPLWFDKIQAGIREARHKLAASQQQYASTRNKIHFRITDALERVRAQQELAKIFAYTIIPQSQQTYEVSRAGYIAGSADFLYVIDNWQKWLMFRIQYHRILGELERSVADLEQVLGASISDPFVDLLVEAEESK